MSEPVQETPETMPCSTCRETIDVLAQKCKTCGAYQDWRRHLGFSSTVLALLVALISVITTSIPILAPWITAPDSKLDIEFLGAANDRASFLVTNTGNRSGTISSVSIDLLKRANGIDDDRIAWHFPIDPTIVPPGGSKQILASLGGEPREIIDRLVLAIWQNNNLEKPIAQPALRFSVRYRDFRSPAEKRVLFQPSLNELLLAGISPWHRCAGSLLSSAWNGDPTSHMVPEQIIPEVVEDRCGAFPPYLLQPKPGSIAPQPDADRDAARLLGGDLR